MGERIAAPSYLILRNHDNEVGYIPLPQLCFYISLEILTFPPSGPEPWDLGNSDTQSRGCLSTSTVIGQTLLIPGESKGQGGGGKGRQFELSSSKNKCSVFLLCGNYELSVIGRFQLLLGK